MGLFGKDKKQPLPALLDDRELDAITEGVNFNSAVDWLVGLSDEDYKKVCEYVTVYREAAAKGAVALGIENEPTTFINPPQPETIESPIASDEPDFLDGDDDIAAAFLADDEAEQKAEAEKVNVKVEKKQ